LMMKKKEESLRERGWSSAGESYRILTEEAGPPPPHPPASLRKNIFDPNIMTVATGIGNTTITTWIHRAHADVQGHSAVCEGERRGE